MDERKPDELPVVAMVTSIEEGKTLFLPRASLAGPMVALAHHAQATALIASLQAEIEQFKQTMRAVTQEAARDELVRSAGDAAARALRRAEAAERKVKEQALQYLSDQGQWIEETASLRQELARLRSSTPEPGC
jgi:hypothetical protein